MLIDCPTMSQYRESCGLGPFVTAYRRAYPQMSSVKIFALYLNDNSPENMKIKALDLYHMKLGWHNCMNISL